MIPTYLEMQPCARNEISTSDIDILPEYPLGHQRTRYSFNLPDRVAPIRSKLDQLTTCSPLFRKI